MIIIIDVNFPQIYIHIITLRDYIQSKYEPTDPVISSFPLRFASALEVQSQASVKSSHRSRSTHASGATRFYKNFYPLAPKASLYRGGLYIKLPEKLNIYLYKYINTLDMFNRSFMKMQTIFHISFYTRREKISI